jgi:hypothetical protein
MLIFTHRVIDAGNDESAFTRRFDPGAPTLGFASVSRAGAGHWALADVRRETTDDTALAALVALFQGGKPVLVYLHGNNNTPAACFERCTRLAEIYELEVLGFSWASEGLQPSGEDLAGIGPGTGDGAADGGEDSLQGVSAANRGEGPVQRKIRRYRQAKTNAQDSVDALARFLRLTATARLYAHQQPATFAAHSLGAHYLQYTLEIDGATESLGTMHNVALLAACTRAAGHRDWLARIRPKSQVFVTYNPADSVLFGAYVADGGQVKLGGDPGSERLALPGVRYVSFQHAQVGVGGHAYFVADAGHSVPKRPRKLFQRMLGSQRDLQAGEAPRAIFPAGCDADGLSCYMAQPDNPDMVGG